MVDAEGMKTVYMNRDFYYTPHRTVSVVFKAGTTYAQVLDKAAEQIEAAGAGTVQNDISTDAVDASRAWKVFGARIKKHGRRGR